MTDINVNVSNTSVGINDKFEPIVKAEIFVEFPLEPIVDNYTDEARRLIYEAIGKAVIKSITDFKQNVAAGLRDAGRGPRSC